jgi:hypothetical protein
MKSIPLEEAFKILQDADAIIVDDGALVYPALSTLDFSDDNEFMFIIYDDDEGLTYELSFYEGDNQEVSISGSSMFLYTRDSDGASGDHTQITILTTKELE